MTPPEFRAALSDLRLSQADLARLMADLGDHRDCKKIGQQISRMATGQSAVSGEMAALLGLLRRQMLVAGLVAGLAA